MKRRTFLALTATSAVAAQGPAPGAASSPPQSSFTIAGRVVNASTLAPLAKILVQIAVTSDRSVTRDVVTGPDGRFAFDNLAANKFVLTATRPSETSQAYLEDGGFSSAVVTGPDYDTSQITFSLHGTGVISGTVTDEGNEPVRNAQVHVFSQRIGPSGLRTVVAANVTTTRSSGQFRVPHLRPGNYLIGVVARPWWSPAGMSVRRTARNGAEQSPASTGGSQFYLTYPVTYYPGVADPAAASPVSVNPGGETPVQVALRSVPSIHVRLSGSEGGSDMHTNVQVVAIGPEGVRIPMNVFSFVQNGQGELSGLAPGRYELTLMKFRAPALQDSAAAFSGGAMDGGRGASNSSHKILDLVDGATVDLGSGTRIAIKASVTIIGSDRPKNKIVLGLRDPATGQGLSATADAEGNFRFPEATVSAGAYDINLLNTPNFRFLSCEAKGAKIVGNRLQIEGNAEVQLVIAIGPRSAIKVEGFAVLENRAVVGAMVLLVPKTPSFGSVIYRDQTNSDGSYAMERVSAGTYYAVAIDNGHDLAYGDPSVLKPYLATAATIKIQEGVPAPQLNIALQHRVS